MTTSNYSIYAIPAFYILALVPQFYSTLLINRATNGRFDNVNPRGASFAETCKKSLDKATLGRSERARAAHTNALENLPLFASAVICANMAGLEKGMVNSVRILLYPRCYLKSLPLSETYYGMILVSVLIILSSSCISLLAIGSDADLKNLKMCGAFLGLRVVYTYVYIGVESPKLALVRTLVWMTSVGCCMTLLFKAGNVLVDGKGMRL